jgi:hypothetical protein
MQETGWEGQNHGWQEWRCSTTCPDSTDIAEGGANTSLRNARLPGNPLHFVLGRRPQPG